MFTQCFKCETVFRLSAEALRAAGGQVRCGRCGEVFNALTRLAESATAFTKGQSPLEMETRAEEILESTGEFEAEDLEYYEQESIDLDMPPGTEVAHLQIIDPISDELLDETSLEFSLPPDDLDRVFVDTRSGSFPALVSVKVPSVDAESVPPAVTLIDVPPSLALVPVTRPGGLEVSENVRDEMLKSYEYAELPQINAPRRQVPFAAWLAAAIVLAVLLLVQILRSDGTWFVAHAQLFGGTAAPQLSSYQLRQWGVTGDPAAKGTLRVRASIMNTSAQLQPYPLLRVTLANRFGTRVGAREFEPAEYLGKPAARLLAPSERIDATLDILDPGKDAEGFEIDVCVRGTDRRVTCTSDVPQPN